MLRRLDIDTTELPDEHLYRARLAVCGYALTTDDPIGVATDLINMLGLDPHREEPKTLMPPRPWNDGERSRRNVGP